MNNDVVGIKVGDKVLVSCNGANWIERTYKDRCTYDGKMVFITVDDTYDLWEHMKAIPAKPIARVGDTIIINKRHSHTLGLSGGNLIARTLGSGFRLNDKEVVVDNYLAITEHEIGKLINLEKNSVTVVSDKFGVTLIGKGA